MSEGVLGPVIRNVNSALAGVLGDLHTIAQIERSLDGNDKPRTERTEWTAKSVGPVEEAGRDEIDGTTIKTGDLRLTFPANDSGGIFIEGGSSTVLVPDQEFAVKIGGAGDVFKVVKVKVNYASRLPASFTLYLRK